MKIEHITRLVEAEAARQPIALVTDLKSGEQAIYEGGQLQPDLALSQAQLQAVQSAFAEDRSQEAVVDNRHLFIHVQLPPPRLIIVGAVHISQALVPMARLAGYEVIVVDPRQAFASAERFPDMELRHDWPDEALAALTPDARTAVVTLTHDPKLDDPALAGALRSECFYIGALGSKKTHAARLERLRSQGFDEAALARIHGPAGLDIGAKSPAEIAISVLAQLTAARRGRAANDL